MKKLIVLALLILPFSIWSQTKGKITYLVSIDKTDIETPYENPDNTDAQNEALEMMHNAQPVEAYLMFNDSIALYDVEPNTELPFWNNNNGIITTDKAKINLTWIFAGGDGLYYTDWSRNYNINQRDIFKVTKRIKKDSIDWVLISETKNIIGYECLKAKIEGTKIEVWYTTKIPIKHGPRGINGLPGLVLEVRDGKRFLTTVTNIDFNNTEYELIEEPREGPLIEEKEYRELGKVIFSEKN